MHVFEIEFPLEFAPFNFAPDLRHAALNREQIVITDNLLRREHGCMRERAIDIDECKPLVEEHRRRVALDQIGHGLIEASRPGFAFLMQL
jgi:hypothetical protein